MRCMLNRRIRKELTGWEVTRSRAGLTRREAGQVWCTGTQKGNTEQTENQKTQKTHYKHAQTIPELT